MFNSVFKIIYFIELVAAIIVRKSFERKNLKLKIVVDKRTNLDVIFLLLNGVGMIIPVIYVVSPWLDFADYHLPVGMGYVGAILFAFAIYLIWRSHHDLGRNWTPIVALRDKATLVTDGIFRLIRHPMYAAHLLWAVAQVFLLPNWLAGYSFLIVQVPFCFVRIRAEEAMMLEQFGEQYRGYMARTSRLIPKIL